jgi:hypothetical protein
VFPTVTITKNQGIKDQNTFFSSRDETNGDNKSGKGCSENPRAFWDELYGDVKNIVNIVQGQIIPGLNVRGSILLVPQDLMRSFFTLPEEI